MTVMKFIVFFFATVHPNHLLVG